MGLGTILRSLDTIQHALEIHVTDMRAQKEERANVTCYTGRQRFSTHAPDSSAHTATRRRVLMSRSALAEETAAYMSSKSPY